VSSGVMIFFPCDTTSQIGQSPPHRWHTLGRSDPNEWSAGRCGCSLHNTQQTQETNIHALSGIRTCDPSDQAAAALHIRPRGHRDCHGV